MITDYINIISIKIITKKKKMTWIIAANIITFFYYNIQILKMFITRKSNVFDKILLHLYFIKNV